MKINGDSINITRTNAGLSRRDALAAMFGGAACFGMPSSGQARKTAPRPIKKLPPAKLGESAGAVKWTSKFGEIVQDPHFAKSNLHALGMAFTVYQTNDGGAVGINDVYAGTVTTGVEALQIPNGKFSSPVLLSDLNMVVIAGTDNLLRTVMRNTDGTLNVHSITLPVAFASNIVAVDGTTFAFVSKNNQLSGFTPSADGSSLSTAFLFCPETRSVSNVCLEATDSNHFVYIVPDNAGQSSCYYLTRSAVIGNFITKFAIGPFCIAGPYIHCLQDDGTLYHVEQHRLDNPPGFQGWKTYLNDDSTLLSNLEISGNAIYFGYGDGTFRAMRLDTGVMSSIPVGDGTAGSFAANRLLIEDGIAYITVPNGKVFAVDLASGGLNSVSYNFASLPNLTIPIGVENGLLVVLTAIPGTGGTFLGYAGVDLSTILHGYSCDSILMAEDYTAGGGKGYMGANAGYRTVVHLVDENKTPRTNTQVRIETTDTVTITTDDGGSTTLANPGDSLWLTTDYNGDLHFVCQADDIQSPALYLWAAFMDPNESIVVYPDHVSLNKLTAAQGADYQNATGFDGTPLLPATGNIDHGQLAQTVSGILGGGSTIAPPAGPYSSYPATQTNMSYQAVKGATGRLMSAGSAQSFTTVVNDDGSISYQPGVSFELVAAKKLQGIQVLSFSDFEKDVIKGAKRLKQLAIKIGTDIEHEITTIDNAVYQFTVTTFEEAVGVISGFFKTIFNDIKKAVEWLSALFDWESIKEAHTQIVGMVTNFRTQVRTYLGQDATALKTALGKYFTDAENSVEGFFNSVGANMGSFQSQQQSGNDPKAAYGSNGSYAQSQSMHSKAKNNIRKTTKWSNAPSTSPLQLSGLLGTFKDLVNNKIPAAIQPLEADIQTAFSDFKHNFGQFTTNPGAFVTHAVQDVFTIIGDLVVLFLKAANLTFDLLIDLIADMLDTAINFVTGGMDIPILSELFQLIYGRPITFLDLVAWMIAVPTSIVSKLSNSPLQSGLLGGENGFQLIAWSVATIFGGVIDALNDALSPAGNDPIAILDLTCAVFAFGLGAPLSFSNDPTICYFAFGAIPLIINFSNIVNAWLFEGGGEAAEAEIVEYGQFCCLAQGVYGILNMGAALFNSQTNPAQFSDPKGSVLAQNIFSNFGLMMKFVYPNQPEATVVTDAVCPLSAAICGVVANA